MHDRPAAPKPLPGAPPGLKKLGRDLRLDACRGLALWFIFLDHVPDNVGSWLTLRNYGFSDTTEVFMFISGVTCALAYGAAQRRQGWGGVITRTLRRSWDIYAAFLLLTLACAVLVYATGLRFADQSNMRILFEQPGPTLAHAAILQYRPVNSDALPTFVVYHLLFAPLLWLLLRAPNLTMAASLVLYALVHIFGWRVPAWPANDWYFNPLAWQVLFVFGAWWTMEGGKLLWPWVTSRTVLLLALTYLASSLVIALSWTIKPLEALIPQAPGQDHLSRGQIRPRSVAAFAFPCAGRARRTVCPARLAGADDMADARRDPLRRELAADLLPRRAAGTRRPDHAERHLRRRGHADRRQPRRHPGHDRRRHPADLDYRGQQAAARTVLRPDERRGPRPAVVSGLDPALHCLPITG